MALFSSPHRRYNPLTGEWVLVSPQRTKRPWLGQVETLKPESLPPYDPDCYLCPGNERAGGARNPDYEHTFIFENDFAALLPSMPVELDQVNPSEPTRGKALESKVPVNLLHAEAERGICRVICFSPRHDLSLHEMDRAEVRRVVDVWAEQTNELGGIEFVKYVQVFENKGAMMGASNPHPHCQVWASEHVPTEPNKEVRSAGRYLAEHGTCLLCDYLAIEEAVGERVVDTNEQVVVLVPFWAVWPFETIVLPRRHIGTLGELDEAEREGIADAIRGVTARYDTLFGVPFPYSMGFHQVPTDGGAHPETHLHAHYYPPLLRSATVRKFMVGYEMLGNPQRDLTAETAAARLRELGRR